MTRRPLLILLAAAAVLAGLLAYAYSEARRAPVVRTAAVALADWPRGAAPLRVVLLSDIHLGNSTMDAARLGRIVQGVDALKPGLILIAGDFVDGHNPHEAARVGGALSAALGRLKAPLGVVAVLGNHDLWTGQADVRAALARAGVTVLQNDAVTRGPLAIAGVADAHTHQEDVAETWRRLQPLAGARVAMTHAPQIVEAIPAEATLVLAAHTHCGQVVLPLIGSVAPNDTPVRYSCGFYRDRGRTVIVTAGLGTSVIPFRLGAPPDVWLLTLGPAR